MFTVCEANMGKKKVVKQTEEEMTRETAVLEAQFSKKIGEKAKKTVSSGKIYIKATLNNTLVTVTDNSGNVLTWMSAGSLGFSGPKKATPFAASKVIEALRQKLERTGPLSVSVYINGIGKGRDAALRALGSRGFKINSIHDITPVPHNGPRPKKVRRV